ncbi:redoxin domain-containing protein [Streptomyces sp. NPDC127197]|uniref:redoxin domain-containing protein n=1 Tax=Streptomyces sp. NPDC127197 TaxID=3345388 RepID=UPI00363C959A
MPEALQFTATTVDGKPFDAKALAGKPAVLWFWAPWCPTCRGQAAETAKVAADYEGKANVVGVAGPDKNAAMRDFVADTGTGTFPHLSDEAGEVWAAVRDHRAEPLCDSRQDRRDRLRGRTARRQGSGRLASHALEVHIGDI